MATASSSSPQSNAAIVLHGVGDLRVEDRPHPLQDAELGAEEVLIGMKAVGICGSDVHYWTHGCIGPFIVKEPMVIGHEAAGIIVRVGAAVTSLAAGDSVAIEPGIPCTRVDCAPCRQLGRYNLCPRLTFFATPPCHGCLARYIKHPAALCYKLPPRMSFEEGALCEPLSVAVSACKRGEISAGDRVLLLGAGPIGTLVMMTAKAFGCSRVTITDVNQSRLDFAKRLGADTAINVSGMALDAVNHACAVGAGTDDWRYDKAIDCCGVGDAIRTGLACLRPGGVMVLLGMASNAVALPLETVIIKEIDIRGSFRYRNCYPVAVDLIASGRVDARTLITHRIQLDGLVGRPPGHNDDRQDDDDAPQPLSVLQQVVEGFSIARDGKDGAIKVMFSM